MENDRVFVSFDYDDLQVKNNLVREAESDTGFTFRDHSIIKAVPHDQNWKDEARRLIGESFFVLVLCGTQSHQSKGQAIELQMAKELGVPHAFLAAARQRTPTLPMGARGSDSITTYTRHQVEELLKKARESR